jgi:hypothetical protein
MVLIVVYIYLKTLQAGLRMFMYDFFFLNFVLLPMSLKYLVDLCFIMLVSNMEVIYYATFFRKHFLMSLL